MVIIADVAYKISDTKVARKIEQIGICSYCIYLLHMQIVQGIVARIPNGLLKTMLTPFIGLFVMMICIFIGVSICNKLSFGTKIKKIVGV